LPRFFFQLSYNGAHFNGWQVQPDAPSVQAAIEDALLTITHIPVKITGAGRTDTGVHAHMMIAHADLPETFLHPFRREGLRRALCGLCRPHIAVQAISHVDDNAHARFDACLRTYRYFLHTIEDPFLRDRSWFAHSTPDFGAMNRAAAMLLGTHDFTSFSKLHTDTKTNICTVSAAQWIQTSPSTFYFEVSADRFLRNMVRAMVGTLINVGMHKISPQEIISTVLNARDRSAAGQSMPAHALFLWDIRYPRFTPIIL